jgi:hypothetical protein
MSKPWKPDKKSVELRPSRIRRDPPATRAGDPDAPDKKLQWQTNEWEIKLAIIGIIAFALAINIIVLGVSAYSG